MSSSLEHRGASSEQRGLAMQIFFINLDDATERRYRMERMLSASAVEVPWQRWRATDSVGSLCLEQPVALCVDPEGN